MGNYTPDQLSAALMRAADYIENADGNVCLNDGEAEHIIAALRFAATLRQQAFSQFANPEALADWLDALHECHADGSVGNRKWEAAQVAARAIRSLNEPSGNSGQLRQQAGRVDEGMVREARDLIDRMDDSTFIADKTLRAVLALAALAQQGEAVAELWIGSPSSEGTTAYGFDRLPLMCDLPPGKYPLYLHAERARVPAEPLDVFSEGVWTYSKTGQSFSEREMDEAAFVVYRDYLAAAPSQRAEVK